MTLREAIEEVIETEEDVWEAYEFVGVTGHPPLREAIATILNAVVRGEFKHEQG